MEALRPVSKLEKILFPLIVTAVVGADRAGCTGADRLLGCSETCSMSAA